MMDFLSTREKMFFKEIFDQRPKNEKLLLPEIGKNQEFSLKNSLFEVVKTIGGS